MMKLAVEVRRHQARRGRFAKILQWPGPLYEGKGTQQIVIGGLSFAHTNNYAQLNEFDWANH